MDPKPKTGFEKDKYTPEKVTIVGREMPMARDAYAELSEVRDITVLSEARSAIDMSGPKRLVSERELFDDLLDFCSRCRDLPVDPQGDAYGYARSIQNIDQFLDTMAFLTHDMYEEAVEGLAARHTQWLVDNPEKKLLFAIPTSREHKSQAAISLAIAKKINPSLSSRVNILTTGELTKDLIDSEIKMILSDDWSVSGNHIADDLAKLMMRLKYLGLDTASMDIEIEFLLARTDQVKDGVHTIARMKEDFADEEFPQKLASIAYFEAPIEKRGFDDITTPTGSHSAADYGFSQTLSRMMVVASQHNVASRMPYIAMIVPEYAHQ